MEIQERDYYKGIEKCRRLPTYQLSNATESVNATSARVILEL
jgi:hypothetical protein